MAFCDIHDNMDLAEEFVKYLISYALDNCSDDLDFLNKMIDKGLIERLNFVLGNEFVRITYTEAVRILSESSVITSYSIHYTKLYEWISPE